MSLKINKPKFYILFFVLCIVAVTACKKNVADIDLNYIGYWEASSEDGYSELVITTDSRGQYLKVKGITTINASGKVKASSKKLRVGVKGFKLDQAPMEDQDGGYLMVLDGVTYYRN